MRYSPAGVFLLAAIAAACNDDRISPVDTERRPPDLTRHVTASVLQHVDASGHFVLPPPKAPDDVEIITPDQARAIATAFMNKWGEAYRPTWEHERAGEPLSLASLRLSDRIYFAVTPHGRFADGYHGAYRRMFGPQYLLFFEANGEPVIGLAIAAYSRDLQIRNGRVEEPHEGGSYFSTHAVTHSGRSPYAPLSPEQAVAEVGKATGAKAAEMPELVLRAGWSPLLALWRVKLDRPVDVRRRDGTRGPVRELFISPRHEFLTARREQPANIGVRAEPTPFRTNVPPAKVAVARRADMPVEFDEVTVIRESEP